MTLFSPLSSPMFRTLKLRGRKAGCPGCSAQSHENDTKAPAINGDNTLVCGTDEQAGDTRINAKDLDQEIHSGKPYVLIDTRPEVEYGICALPDSISKLSKTFLLVY
jgi:adenylyltransferase/sulfurtransferase